MLHPKIAALILGRGVSDLAWLRGLSVLVSQHSEFRCGSQNINRKLSVPPSGVRNKMHSIKSECIM